MRKRALIAAALTAATTLTAAAPSSDQAPTTAVCADAEAALAAPGAALGAPGVRVLVVADMSRNVNLGVAGGLVRDAIATGFGDLRMQVSTRWVTTRTGAAALTVDQALDAARTAVGGTRPDGIDLVYFLTDAPLTLAGVGPVEFAAACLGGIADGDMAFAVGQYVAGDAANLRVSAGALGDLGNAVDPDGDVVRTPNHVGVFENRTGKAFLGGVGTLLGATAPLANCVQGTTHRTVEDATGACTVMGPNSRVNSLRFSAANGGVVRAFAAAYGQAS